MSDLHLTSNERDEYRWGLFPWVREQGAARLLILGDLTDAKDYHPAQLVNRLVSELEQTAELMEVHIVRGNHDGIDPEWPYFRFLNAIPNIYFYHEPSYLCEEPRVLVLPHTRDYEGDWGDLDLGAEVILLHATVQGAQAEAGGSLSGIPAGLFHEAELVLAGDVHVPQKVGKVEYVGAPYPIRFGDKFRTRAIYFNKQGKREARHFETLQRLSLVLDSPEQLNPKTMREGDQYKIKMLLDKASALDWTKVKQAVRDKCKQAKVDLISLDLERKPEGKVVSLKKRAGSSAPSETLDRYCDQKGVTPLLRETGQALLKTTLANAVKTL